MVLRKRKEGLMDNEWILIVILLGLLGAMLFGNAYWHRRSPLKQCLHCESSRIRKRLYSDDYDCKDCMVSVHFYKNDPVLFCGFVLHKERVAGCVTFEESDGQRHISFRVDQRGECFPIDEAHIDSQQSYGCILQTISWMFQKNKQHLAEYVITDRLYWSDAYSRN